MYTQQLSAFQALHTPIPRKHTAKWEAMSMEPVRAANGKWTSPLMDPVAEGMQFTSCQTLLRLIAFA